MSYYDTRWDKLKNCHYTDNLPSNGEMKKFLNSSDDSEDEEWMQQLQRDYGKKNRSRYLSWSKMNKLERQLLICLIISIVLILSIVLALIVRLIVVNAADKHGKNLNEKYIGNGVCVSKACINAADRINSYLDETEQPCQDFYNYACGNWLKSVSIPTGHSKWTSFNQISDRNLLLLKRILDQLYPRINDSEAIHKVHRYYRACLNKERIEAVGDKPLRDLIKYVGSWSITSEQWNDEDWNFGQALGRIHHLRSTPLFQMFVSADDRNSKRHVIQIQQAGITLPDEEFYRRNSSDKVIRAYKRLMVETGVLLGGSRERTEKQMSEVFEFEKKLAKIFEAKETLRQTDKIYHKMTLEQLQDLCPAISWLDYVNSMFRDRVPFDEPVVVYTPNYLKNVSDLVIRTERRILANYMVWHLIKPMLALLSKPYRDLALEFVRVEKGVDLKDPSWKNCVTRTDGIMGFATGSLFVKEMEEKERLVKSDVEQMILNIRQSFVDSLPTVNWMDYETKSRAIDKAKAVVDMMGYPEWIMDPLKLSNYYKNLDITDNSFQNYLKSREFLHEKSMNRRGQPVDRLEWHMTPTEVNAYYNSPNNYIAFPFGILQPPFYHPDLPSALNYGAIGAIMGHELTHGFDTKGRLFDKDGNMRDWWSDNSVDEFHKHSQCMMDQYSNFTINGLKINGRQTLGENIADNGGLKAAFNAFKRQTHPKSKQRYLPAVSLTNDQLFFVGFAQVWCSAATNRNVQDSVLADSHSPERIRVQAAVSNSEEFAKAFECKLGAKMNPTQKCRVW